MKQRVTAGACNTDGESELHLSVSGGAHEELAPVDRGLQGFQRVHRGFHARVAHEGNQGAAVGARDDRAEDPPGRGHQTSLLSA